MILLLDNYDSFTYNLKDYLEQTGIQPEVLRNDELSLEEFKQLPLKALIISPGPERPEHAGLLMPMLDHFVSQIPILGICLGHQAIGIHFGSVLGRAMLPMHGKTSLITTRPHFLFEGMTSSIQVMRYHSLILHDCPKDFEIIANTEDGVNMAMQHHQLPITSVQFHPESILTNHGLQMIKNWVTHYKL